MRTPFAVSPFRRSPSPRFAYRMAYSLFSTSVDESRYVAGRVCSVEPMRKGRSFFPASPFPESKLVQPLFFGPSSSGTPLNLVRFQFVDSFFFSRSGCISGAGFFFLPPPVKTISFETLRCSELRQLTKAHNWFPVFLVFLREHLFNSVGCDTPNPVRGLPLGLSLGFFSARLHYCI